MNTGEICEGLGSEKMEEKAKKNRCSEVAEELEKGRRWGEKISSGKTPGGTGGIRHKGDQIAKSR